MTVKNLQFFKRSFSLNPVNYLVIISSKLFEIQTVNAFFEIVK